ncbi:uncharacterized protein LOC108632273 [Ceratina calcarata]|uniref:Uncharacterized protein LOC108632273 n=1 Tax=Ceratina calcarata TaxID=156304 RepID=A0AAJ7JFC1_9HYME|nr:uncharacterized protein LOC108632273 [Ceratina calcarata]
MPIAWTEVLTLRLVTLYSKHECLRDPFHPDFNNKLCRYKAYKEIVDSMNVCGLTVCDCIKRITYVKSQYCYELSKISASIACEKFYKPATAWFPMMHRLFFPFMATYTYADGFCKQRDEKTNRTEDQLTHSNLKEHEPSGRNCDCPYAICYCNKSYRTRPYARLKKPEKPFSIQAEYENAPASRAKDSLYSRPKRVSRIDAGNNTRRSINAECSTQTDMSCFKTICTACQVCVQDEISLNCANLANILMKNDLTAVSFTDLVPGEEDVNEKRKTDEFDMFGKSIAFQLRNISFEIAIKLEKRIQDLIAKERLVNMKSKCSDCCSSSSCSECKLIHQGMMCSCGLPVIMIKTDPSCDFDCKQRT